MLSFKNLGLDLRLPPLYSLPRTTHIPPGRPKISVFFVLDAFFSIFGPSKKNFKICFEKSSKKMRKSKVLASQNPPKTPPKSFRNRGSRKHTKFHRFCWIFCCLLQKPNIKICAPSQCFVDFSHNSAFDFQHVYRVRKTYQKPFQNDARTLPKSMPKTCYFLTSIF